MWRGRRLRGVVEPLGEVVPDGDLLLLDVGLVDDLPDDGVVLGRSVLVHVHDAEVAVDEASDGLLARLELVVGLLSLARVTSSPGRANERLSDERHLPP